MRADTGGRALVLPCPQCATRWSTEQTLAGHLMDEHGMEPAAAVRRALETSRETRRGQAIQAGQQGHQKEDEISRVLRDLLPDGRAVKEATPMANEAYTCGKCGVKGHNARSPECPAKGKPATEGRKPCGYCKHTDHVYADCPMAQARRKGAKRKPITRNSPKASASPNGYASTLATLRAERDELTAAITVLERLEARGR